MFSARSYRYFAIAAAVAASLHAQVVTTLVSFDVSNGEPNSLVQGTDGNFYGTSTVRNDLIFKLTPTGVYSMLYRFTASLAGVSPLGGLIQLADGNFYGTTTAGGSKGVGTIFKVTPGGTVTVLYSFRTNATDGFGSQSGLLQGSDGNLYGTTQGGGANALGTIFRLTPGGQYTTLYAFGAQGNDGGRPVGRLIQATDSNIYGTTEGAGKANLGTAFRISPAGVFTTLYAFAGSPADGAVPQAGLIQGSDGNFYGTTNGGGKNTGGTVFKMTAAGAVTIIHSFDGNDGANPTAPLLQASDGNLYGTTSTTIFKITPAGVFTTVYTFNTADISSNVSLIQASDGNLYGVGSTSGSNGFGSVFKIFLTPNPPPAPPTITSGGVVPVYSNVSTIQAGEWVSIYGTNLASATAIWNGDFPLSLANTNVTIDGKSAYLWYVSPTQINLQAPQDTATGTVPVVVTTPGGSVMSTVTLAQFAPSFSLLDAKHVAGIILRPDGSGALGSGSSSYDIVGPTGTSLGYKTVAAKAGDTVVLFAVGLGPTSPGVPAGAPYTGSAATTNPVTVLVNNVSVTPSFSGETSAGLYQLNLKIPPGLGAGDMPLQAIVGGLQTPAGPAISLQ